MTRRRPTSLYLPSAIDAAIRRKAARTDTAISRILLRYVREGLARDGEPTPADYSVSTP